jgi:hypothetical protein
MNCGDVRLWLASRPSVVDDDAGGVAAGVRREAERHLGWCGDCRDEAARLRDFEVRLKDRLVAWLAADESTRAVAESAGAKARLLSLLESVPVDSSTGAHSSPAADTRSGAAMPAARPALPKTSRRGVRRLVIWSVAALLLVGLGTFLLMSRPARLDRAEVELASLGQAALLREGSAGVPGAWPASLDRRLLSGAVPAVVEVRGRLVEVIQFAFRRRNGVVQGRLLIIPVASLADRPASTVYLSGSLRYVDRFAATWWVEGQFAYACCLTTAEEEAFRSLQPRRLAT